MNYGVPYMGSKNMLAKKIADALPCDGFSCFVDLFAGGCAITHAVMLKGGFERYVVNDLDGGGVRLFVDAVNGKYHDERRWISREDFFRLKDSDPYVRLCWSFGNNCRTYLYSKEIEPWKKALHFARVLGDCSLLREIGVDGDGSREDVRLHHDEYKAKYIRWWLLQQEYNIEELDALIARCKGQIAMQEEELRQYLLRALKDCGLTQAEVQRRLGTQMSGHYFGRSQWAFPTEEYYNKMREFMPLLDKDYNEVVGLHNLWESLQCLQRLQSLESLESLQRLQRLQSLESLQSLQCLQRLQSLERLEVSFKSYDEVDIPRDALVMCDPPYKGTNGYTVRGELQAFDHAAFYDWCERQTALVVISEYQMPEDRFVCVKEMAHRSRLSGSANNSVTEKLFAPRGQSKRWYDAVKRPRWVQLELF